MSIQASPNLAQRLDHIIDRMDAAYAERKRHRDNTHEYDTADEALEAVYTDLRALTAEMRPT